MSQDQSEIAVTQFPKAKEFKVRSKVRRFDGRALAYHGQQTTEIHTAVVLDIKLCCF